MKKILSLLIVSFLLTLNPHAGAQDFIFDAMSDELDRSMEKLELESLKKPYYIEYKISFKTSYVIHSALGSITDSDKEENAYLDVDLRVGDYKFDNSNFLDYSSMGFFFGFGGDNKFQKRPIPLNPSYESLRRELWLATDGAYKQSAEVYSKKLAALKNRTRRDTTSDYTKLPPKQIEYIAPKTEFDLKEYENKLKEISEVFKDFPEIEYSTVGMEFLPETVYFLNTEGRRYKKRENYTGLEIVVATQAKDGMPLIDHYVAIGKSPGDLPSQDSLIKAARNLAASLTKLRKAPVLFDAYSGPIIFEKQAAAEIFAQVFAPNLVTQRKLITPKSVREIDDHGAFQTKIGGRVLPEFLSVKAIPGKDKFEETFLIGSYEFDEEGVPAENVTLVKDGFLKNLLSSRTPIKRVLESNGHCRGGAAMLSSIKLFPGEEDKQKTKEQLIDRQLQLCKDRALNYGIVITKILNQNIQYTTLNRLTRGAFKIKSDDKQKWILVGYKIFPDGRRELIRGLETNGFAPHSFKDILEVGNEYYVMNYLAPSITSPYFTNGKQYVGSTVITPDILFEDGEIRPIEADFPNPPFLSNPLNNNK